MGTGTVGWPVIEKPRGGWAVEPNLVDYRSTRATFYVGGCTRGARVCPMAD